MKSGMEITDTGIGLSPTPVEEKISQVKKKSDKCRYFTYDVLPSSGKTIPVKNLKN
jgi:hypothetical protein